MKRTTMGEVLGTWEQFDLEDEIYVPANGSCRLDTEVMVVPGIAQLPKEWKGFVYLLGFEQVREQIEGFEKHFGRPLTPEERLVVVAHYAEFDAPINDDDELIARAKKIKEGDK